MANSIYEATGDGSTTDFTIPYTYLEADDVTAFVGGVSTSFTFTSSNVVTFASAPANGVTVRIVRNTDLDNLNVTYSDGGALTAQQLNNSNNQLLFGVQEAIDRANESIAVAADGKFDAQTRGIKNVATPTNANDATNKSYVDTSANNAASSAAAALVSQNAAASSATAAANSATASAASATTSANEATDSANSATASANSAATASTQAALATTNGAAQVALATTQANNAASSASTASTQASNASTSASTSTTQATNSANSATASANSATAAAGSASTASTQAALATTNGAAQVALATTQANNAATSATAAANSATAASTSETNAANSAAAAAAAFDNFDDTYLGSKTSDPTVDNDGNALVSGALYFNSSANEMRVYDGANWIAASSAGTASLLEYKYTATAGQTTFSGSDDASNTLSYTVDNLIVTLNGVVLENGTDYTATSGTSIVLASGAAVSDELNVIAFKSFTTADMVSKTNGGTFVGAVTFDGGANFGDNVRAKFGAGNDLQIYHDGSDSYINDTGTGNLRLAGAAGVDIIADSGETMAKFISNGASELYHNNGKSLETTSVGVTVNGNLGIGTAVPAHEMHIQGSSTTASLSLKGSGTGTAASDGIELKLQGDNSAYLYNYENAMLRFGTNGLERVRITSDGKVGINTASPSVRLDAKSSGEAAIGIGSTNAGGAVLYLDGDSNGDYAGTDYSYIQHDSNGRLNIVQNSPSGTNQLRLYTGNTERMRFDGSGNLLVGLTSPVNAQSNFYSVSNWAMSVARPSAGSAGMIRFENGSNLAGTITTSTTAVQYNTTSDYRLKENVTGIANATDRLKQLNPVRFNFISDADTTVDGFLAHEVQDIVPEAISGEKDAMKDEQYEVTPAVLDDDGNEVTPAEIGTRNVPDYQGIDQSKLVPLLCATLKESIAKIETLETEMTTLKERVNALENTQ